MSPRARLISGGVGTGVSALALVGDLAFLVTHNEHMHFDVHLLLGLAGLLAVFTALGLSVALLLAARAEVRRTIRREPLERDPGTQDLLP